MFEMLRQLISLIESLPGANGGAGGSSFMGSSISGSSIPGSSIPG